MSTAETSSGAGSATGGSAGPTTSRGPASPRDRMLRLRPSLSGEALQAHLMEAERASLESTFATLATDSSLSRAAGLILASRRKYIAGAGKSAAYAALLNADLAATLPNVMLIGDGPSATDVLSDVRPSDVCIVFSLRRYRIETVRLGRLFAQSGGRLVVVTDGADAPLAEYASVLILVDTGSASYADSPTAMAAVCHLLSSLASASAKGARRRLANRDTATTALGIYWDQDAGIYSDDKMADDSDDPQESDQNS